MINITVVYHPHRPNPEFISEFSDTAASLRLKSHHIIVFWDLYIRTDSPIDSLGQGVLSL